MKRMTMAAALISVLVLLTAPAAVQAQFAKKHLDFDTDHFKCYRGSHEPFPPIQGVTLVDQFDQALGLKENVEIFVFLRLCNPAMKFYGGTVTPMKNPNHHLVLYHFNPLDQTDKPMQGTVVVANQFGQQKLKIESARILAVPTAKVPGVNQPSSGPPEIPRDLDHYKCYYATGQAPDPAVVGLADQFETYTLNHKLREPVLFCNPVTKTVVDAEGNEQTYVPKHPDEHLTCYGISILTEYERPAWVYNQFFPDGRFMLARSADVLCVPSKKVRFKLGGENLGLTTGDPGGR